MAQEFKTYNKKYAKSRGKALEIITKAGGLIAKEDIAECAKWPRKLIQWGNEDIREAVYLTEGAEAWQEFRVSLKGLTTKEKIYCLAWMEGQAPQVATRIRVDNYIGALVRGGLLDHDLKVVR